MTRFCRFFTMTHIIKKANPHSHHRTYNNAAIRKIIKNEEKIQKSQIFDAENREAIASPRDNICQHANLIFQTTALRVHKTLQWQNEEDHAVQYRTVRYREREIIQKGKIHTNEDHTFAVWSHPPRHIKRVVRCPHANCKHSSLPLVTSKLHTRGNVSAQTPRFRLKYVPYKTHALLENGGT